MSDSGIDTYRSVDTPQELGLELMARCDGIALGPGDVLYLYDSRVGVYAEGEGELSRLAQRILDNAARTSRIAEGKDWVRRHDIPRLWERPSPDVINVKNGLLHLSSSKQLTPHSPEFLTTVQIPVDFDPRASCPGVDRFLAEALPPDAIPVFHEVAGYLLTPDVSQKRAIMLVGPTDTGKSTAIDLLTALLGRDNVSHISLHDLAESRFAAAGLIGKLLNAYPDLESRMLRNPAVFKALTGRDTISVERKFQQPFTYLPFARHLFAANKAPASPDTSNAFFNRWLILPFRDSVPRDRQDLRLIDSMTAPDELSGFLNLALEGLDRLRRRVGSPGTELEFAL